MEKVSVLIASSNKGLCQSLKNVLNHEEWISVVGTSVSKADTLALAKTFEPQVVVIDFSIAGDDLGIGEQIIKVSPDAKIIVLSKYDLVGKVDVKTISGAPNEKTIGVDSIDWLSKDSNPGSLLKLIHAVKRERQIH